MKQKIISILKNSWVLALFPAILFVFVLLPLVVHYFTTIGMETVFKSSALKYAFYLLVYGVFLLAIFLSRKYFSIGELKRLEVEDKLLRLELKSIKHRMDPHFIFNAMGLISNLVLKGDKVGAYDCITKFSGLLRETLDFSEVTGIRLSDELSLVKKYIELEMMRFAGKFNFQIEIDDQVNLNQRILKSTILTYVENAIKMGLFHRESGGLLLIKISKNDIYTSIEIIDNGIGREAAANMRRKNKGNGQVLMNEYFEIFNEINTEKLKYSCADLFDKSGNPSGTSVQIDIPENYITGLSFPKSMNASVV